MKQAKTPNEIFLAVDGDDVGHRLEYLMLANEVESLERFSAQFQSTMHWLKETLMKELGGKIIFSGGDNLLVRLPLETSPEVIKKLCSDFYQKAERTLSVGMGQNPRQAYIALNFAKASGKNCIRHFKELPDG